MTFSEQFIKIMDVLASHLGIAIDWTSQNIVPYVTDLCTRIVQMEMFNHIMWIILSIVLAIITSLFYRFFKKKLEDEEYGYYEDEYCLAKWATFTIGYISSIAIFSANLYFLAQCYFLPELVILEKIQTLIK